MSDVYTVDETNMMPVNTENTNAESAVNDVIKENDKNPSGAVDNLIKYYQDMEKNPDKYGLKNTIIGNVPKNSQFLKENVPANLGELNMIDSIARTMAYKNGEDVGRKWDADHMAKQNNKQQLKTKTSPSIGWFAIPY